MLLLLVVVVVVVVAASAVVGCLLVRFCCWLFGCFSLLL